MLSAFLSATGKAVEVEESMAYNLVKSSDLYAEQHRIIAQYGILRSYETVSFLEASSEGVTVNTPNTIHHSAIVFDSRPPQFLSPQTNEAHLQQSFFGYFIACDKPNSEHEAIDLMDFNVVTLNNGNFIDWYVAYTATGGNFLSASSTGLAGSTTKPFQIFIKELLY
jgi:hypothetical protein